MEFLLLRRLFAAWAVTVAAATEPGNCSIAAARYGLTDFPEFSVDRSKSTEPLTFCEDYNANTCCGLRDDLRIRSRFVNLVAKAAGTDEGVSVKCADMLRKVACLPCDGHLATQSKLPSICRSFCDSWFDSCRGDFFTVVSSGNRLDLCDPKSSLICSRLDEIVSDSTELCERSGVGQVLEMDGDEEEVDGDFDCFDAQPSPEHASSIAWQPAAPGGYDEIYHWLLGNSKVFVLAAFGLLLVVAKMYTKIYSRGGRRREDTRLKDARKDFLERWQRQHDDKIN
ncbi:hypothetical protein FOZ63_030958 [Perkinsus olseni]|uniref:Folate receptor-like domain-containing protein n=1 Tax=Perkinsus olseni TaxID=32597 RepID=A0A7J6Q8I0_PEROL|nr:hypothetical protein FOZ60_012799 [Perkinsus olseni]KAF4704623.1 hypothetical protein FOZ62_007772 [Perkinsus olseni]KAF4718778.1 hypothetical protein FOZ63_030958 [Perkinsus olseni]